MVWLPAASVEVVQVDWLPSGPPRVTAAQPLRAVGELSAKNPTVPPSSPWATVAVNVTLWPYVASRFDEVTVAVVVSADTGTVTGVVADRSDVSVTVPLNVAVTICAGVGVQVTMPGEALMVKPAGAPTREYVSVWGGVLVSA